MRRLSAGPKAALAALVLLVPVAALTAVRAAEPSGPDPAASARTPTATTSATQPSAAQPSAAQPSAAPGASASGESAPKQQTVRVQQESASRPVRVRVPAVGIDSRLDRLATTSGNNLESPPRWQVAGWFADGPRPGESGPAVIAGHVDSPTGSAVFTRLSEVRAGQVVDVVRRDGSTVRFRVDRTELAAQDHFPTAAVYGPTPDAQLRLITCDGPYVESRGGYQDNRIVYATYATETGP